MRCFPNSTFGQVLRVRVVRVCGKWCPVVSRVTPRLRVQWPSCFASTNEHPLPTLPLLTVPPHGTERRLQPVCLQVGFSVAVVQPIQCNVAARLRNRPLIGIT